MSTVCKCTKTTCDSKWKQKKKKKTLYKTNKNQVINIAKQILKLTIVEDSVGSNNILENNSNEDRRHVNDDYNSNSSNCCNGRSLL